MSLKSLIPRQTRFVAVYMVLVMAVGGFCTMLAIASVVSQDKGLSWEEHQAVVRAMEGQVSLVKWVGAAIVGSLSAAIGLLYRSLEKSNTQTHKYLSDGIKHREDLIISVTKCAAEMVQSQSTLTEEIRDLATEIKEIQRKSSNEA